MEYFNIEKYKDWEVDTNWTSNKTTKFLKKGNERIEIYFFEEGIQVRIKNKINSYEVIKGFSNTTKRLLVLSQNFYQMPIGVTRQYDETGKVIKEIDNERDYLFPLKALIEKIKKENNVDLEDFTKGGWIRRWVDTDLKKPIYEVYLKVKDMEGKREYILIDGNTGEILFTTFYFIKDEESITPFYQYLIALKKKEVEGNAYYKTYKGKDYTKKEWEIFEEEWYKNYKENKDRDFWDSIFKRPGEK